MLARRALPWQFVRWNRKWGAPSGRMGRLVSRLPMRQSLANGLAPVLGPFAYQSNSSTRTYEYPWAYYTLRPRPGERILEIGGALSGLQFALARAGSEVHNVDPFVDYGSGDYRRDPEKVHGRLNKAFGTDVRLYRATLPEAGVVGTFDAIFSVSTLEHVPRDDLVETLTVARRLLKPGGRIVLTVDLFLNLDPFCGRQTNRWGTNVPPAWIGEVLGMTLTKGRRSELLGFEAFSAASILEHLEDYAISVSYPQMAQLMSFGPA